MQFWGQLMQMAALALEVAADEKTGRPEKLAKLAPEDPADQDEIRYRVSPSVRPLAGVAAGYVGEFALECGGGRPAVQSFDLGGRRG
jgi:hypothetical protein